VFSIQYDGEWVRYYRNGGLIREKSAPGLTLFMDSSFFHPGAVATDVTVGPLTTATPNPFLARGNCKISGDSISKFNGSSAWDSDAYSIKGYPTCHVSFKPTYTEDVMVGLNSDPTTDQSYTSIDYAWYVQTTGNVIGIYESGSSIGNFGTYTPQTLLAITYDGTNIRYYKDDLTTAVRTVAVSGLTLFMDSAFYTPERHQLRAVWSEHEPCGDGHAADRSECSHHHRPRSIRPPQHQSRRPKWNVLQASGKRTGNHRPRT
jgi:hypothetical protein